jgi:hypothetical protein
MSPAIAVGNSSIFKISGILPLGALALGRLVVEAGFTSGVINFINGTGEVGSSLASHMKVAEISFMCSTETGWRVQVASAQSNLKRCTLELGGKSAALVFDEAALPPVAGFSSSTRHKSVRPRRDYWCRTPLLMNSLPNRKSSLRRPWPALEILHRRILSSGL